VSVRQATCELFAAQLKPRGFRRRSASWYRSRGDVYVVVNVEATGFGGGGCHINVGVSPADWITGSWFIAGMCPLQFRAEQLTAVRPSDMALVDDDRALADIGDLAWRSAASRLITGPVIQVADGLRSLQDVASLIRDGLATTAFVHDDLRTLLAAPPAPAPARAQRPPVPGGLTGAPRTPAHRPAVFAAHAW
jgi:hypothetical protein